MFEIMMLLTNLFCLSTICSISILQFPIPLRNIATNAENVLFAQIVPPSSMQSVIQNARDINIYFIN